MMAVMKEVILLLNNRGTVSLAAGFDSVACGKRGIEGAGIGSHWLRGEWI